MDLIERYLKAVSARLPAAKRAEVEAELRSSILDALEDRGGTRQNEEDVVAVLEQLGDPAVVAAGYDERGQYLVGPELYPTFRRVLGLVLAAVVVLSGLTMVLELLRAGNPMDFAAGDMLMRAISRAIGGSIQATIVVVVVFVMIQRVGRTPELPKGAPFDPRRLPALPDSDRASRLDAGFSLAITALVGVIVGAIGMEAAIDGIFGPPALSGLADAFIENLSLLMASLLLEAVMWTVVLIDGRWRLGTRGLRSLADVVAMVAFARFALAVVDERPALEAIGMPPEGVTILIASLAITVLSIGGLAIGREWRDYRRRTLELSGFADPAQPPPVSTPDARAAR